MFRSQLVNIEQGGVQLLAIAITIAAILLVVVETKIEPLWTWTREPTGLSGRRWLGRRRAAVVVVLLALVSLAPRTEALCGRGHWTTALGAGRRHPIDSLPMMTAAIAAA